MCEHTSNFVSRETYFDVKVILETSHTCSQQLTTTFSSIAWRIEWYIIWQIFYSFIICVNFLRIYSFVILGMSLHWDYFQWRNVQQYNYQEFRQKYSIFMEFVNVFPSPNEDSHSSSNDNYVYLLPQSTWKYFLPKHVIEVKDNSIISFI